MASDPEVQAYIDGHHQQCFKTLQLIALLGDTCSDEYYRHFNTGPGQPVVNGWRVAEKMQQIANDVVGSIPISSRFTAGYTQYEIDAASTEDLMIYKRAMESMAAQFVHPKMTAREMAEMQLRERD